MEENIVSQILSLVTAYIRLMRESQNISSGRYILPVYSRAKSIKRKRNTLLADPATKNLRSDYFCLLHYCPSKHMKKIKSHFFPMLVFDAPEKSENQRLSDIFSAIEREH